MIINSYFSLRTFLISTFLLIAVFSLTNCSHKRVEPELETIQFSNLNQFFDQNRAESIQTFSVSNEEHSVVIGQNGTQLFLDEHQFHFSNGDSVTGMIDIELTEILSISEMIRNNTPTTSYGEILVSGGQIKLTAFQNDQRIYSDSSILVQIPTTAPDTNMQLFNGLPDSLISTNINWVSTAALNLSNSITIALGLNSSNSFYSFNFENPDLQWINCDYFWNTNPVSNTTITLKLPANLDNSNTTSFLIFPDINSVASLYWSNEPGEMYFNRIPVGTAAIIATISDQEGEMFAAFDPVIIQEDHSLVQVLTPFTEEKIKSIIDEL